MELTTQDIFQQNITEFGEVIEIANEKRDEILLYISGHKSTWTAKEFQALAKAMHEFARVSI